MAATKTDAPRLKQRFADEIKDTLKTDLGIRSRW